MDKDNVECWWCGTSDVDMDGIGITVRRPQKSSKKFELYFKACQERVVFLCSEGDKDPKIRAIATRASKRRMVLVKKRIYTRRPCIHIKI